MSDYAKKLIKEAEAETDRRAWMIEYVTRNGHSMEDPDTRDFVDSAAKDLEGFKWLKADAEKPKESAVKLLYTLYPVNQINREAGDNAPPPPMTVSLSPPQVTLSDGKTHSLSPDAATLLKALVDDGDWISAGQVVNQPSRVRDNMPPAVRSLIKTSPGKGFRLVPPT